MFSEGVSVVLCLFIKQRLSLAIGSLGMRNATEETVTSVVLGTRYVERSHQEKTEDDERKDPLQGDDLNGKLTQCKGYISISSAHLYISW